MSIYKECDIRGIYRQELDIEKAGLIGKSVGTILKGGNVVVAGDARNSTKDLKESLIAGLISCGCQVVDLGTVPTPLLYFAKDFLKTDGAVMVTASHNPAQYNGFKISLGGLPVKPKDIKMISSLVESKRFLRGWGDVVYKNIQNDYMGYLKRLIGNTGPLKVVLDCGNGAASEVAPRLFTKLGHDVSRLFCSFDGSFPNRSPNPSVEKNLSALKEKVLVESADLGIAFDGDGDRAIFVDNKGRFCEPEKSFVILLGHYLQKTTSTVVYDAKSSSIVKKAIESLGSIPLMERSGHAFMKTTFLKNKSVLAGEVSGHYFFGELGFDDGIYAAIKMAEIVAESKKSMSELIDDIESTIITPDIRIGMSPNRVESILGYLKKYAQKYQASFLDGVRIEFSKGWILARKSVTEPCITIRLEADNIAEAKKINQELFFQDYFDVYETINKNLQRLTRSPL